MNGLLQFITEAPTIIKMVAIALAILFALFVGAFLVPAARSWFRLSALARKLKTLDGRRAQPLDDIFANQGHLFDLWKVYKDTLHEQQEFENGRVGVRQRSTVPASLVFTGEIVVDSPLSTEFFKHLPGLFTGVGIIGTFWGLIQGLQAFRISEDPSVVRNSLEGLMHRVSDAFIVSATAIFLAMATTFLEKMLITILYGKVEEITASLDRVFDSGAGEEYLARIVKATEETSEQNKLLKDALVTDLTRILTDLADKQIEANKIGFHGIGTQVGEILKGPLDKIGDGIGEVSGGNSDAVGRLLTDVLAGFSQKLQDLFGGQISGINELQQKTVESLESAVGKLNEMVANIGLAGAKTSVAMDERLVAALSAMEAHQNRTNEQMSAFVDNLRALVSESQSETNRKLQETLAEIGDAVRAQIAALKAQADDAATRHGDREDKISTQTQEAIRLLGTRVEDILGSMKSHGDENAKNQIDREQRLATHVAETVAALSSVAEKLMSDARLIAGEVRTAIEAMRGVTSDAVSKMSGGADTLYLAASEFTTAGNSVRGALEQATATSGELVRASGSLATASGVLQGVVADHATARQTFASMLESLNGSIANAKKEATVTHDIVARIEASAQRLGQAQLDIDEYLGGVSKVLGEANDRLSQSLKAQHNEFYAKLSAAAALLSNTAQELAVAIQREPEKV